ncbi:MAG: DUF3575 domain-containing protein [Bacteroidota bacterium]
MKKLITLATLVVLALPMFAQDKPAVSEEPNVVKVNTLSLLVGTGSLFYERKLSDNLSGQMGVGYLSYKIEDSKFSGLILTPEVRFYPKSNAIDGFYLAPYFRYQNFKLENTETNDKGTYANYGGGLAIGRQWITDSGFTMDLFFGGHYSKGSIETEEGATGDNFDVAKFEGFRIRIGFSIGFAF